MKAHSAKTAASTPSSSSSSRPKSVQAGAAPAAAQQPQVPTETVHLVEKNGTYDGGVDKVTKKKCGDGTFKFNSDGEKLTCGMISYTGAWANGSQNGKGVVEWKNGLCKLKGEFRSGQAAGHGSVKFKDGTTSEQWWHAGVAIQVVDISAPEPEPHPTLTDGFPLKESKLSTPSKSSKSPGPESSSKMSVGEFQSRISLWKSLSSHFGFVPVVWTVQILINELDRLARMEIEALILTAIEASVPNESGLVPTFLDPENGRFCTLWDVINQSIVLEKAVELFCKNGPSKDFTLDKMRKIFKSSSAFSWSGRELLPLIEAIYKIRSEMEANNFPDDFRISLAMAAGKSFAMFRRLSAPALNRALSFVEYSELKEPQEMLKRVLKLPDLVRERSRLEHASRNMSESLKGIQKILSDFGLKQSYKKVYPIGMRFLTKFFMILSACALSSKVNRALNWCRILGVYIPLVDKVSKDDSKSLKEWFPEMIELIDAELGEIKALMNILCSKSKNPDVTSNNEILAELVIPNFTKSPKRLETNFSLLKESVSKIIAEKEPSPSGTTQEKKQEAPQSYGGYLMSFISYFFTSTPTQEVKKEETPTTSSGEKKKTKKKKSPPYSVLEDGLVPLNKDLIAFLNNGNIWIIDDIFKSCDDVVNKYASRLISTIELAWKKDTTGKTSAEQKETSKSKKEEVEFNKKYCPELINAIMKFSEKGILSTDLCNNSFRLLSIMLSNNEALINEFVKWDPKKDAEKKSNLKILLGIASQSAALRDRALMVLSAAAQSTKARTQIYSIIGIKELFNIAQQSHGEENGKTSISSKLAMQTIGYLCYDQNCLHEALDSGILPILFDYAKTGKVLLHTPIQAKEITLEKELGRGAYATVYKGKWKGREVAVKVFSESSFQFRLEDFLQEIAIMSIFRHPNLMKMYGAVVERSRDAESKFMIVTELLGSSLQHILFSNNVGFLPELILEYAINISAAMSYLHSFNMIHRDLKSANLLMSPDGSVRLCDLGLSRIVSKLSMTICAGTPKWEAPECIETSSYTTAADVYSFGMVLWEMKTAKEPYPEVTGFMELKKLVCDKKKRPDIPPDTPKWLKDLIKACWTHNPKKRPSFDEIYKGLSELKSSLKKKT